MKACDCGWLANPERRAFVATAAAAVAGVASSAAVPAALAKAATSEADRRKFIEEATRLAIESVERRAGAGRSGP
jgi:guanine deaminase